jgi:hypothetical protein
MFTNGKIVVCKYIVWFTGVTHMENDLLFCSILKLMVYWLSVKSTLGQNCQMLVSMRAKKKPAGIKLQYFCQYGDRKKTQPTKEQS